MHEISWQYDKSNMAKAFFFFVFVFFFFFFFVVVVVVVVVVEFSIARRSPRRNVFGAKRPGSAL